MDYEKVAKGVEFCSEREKFGKADCKKCPYYEHEIDCREMLFEDILAILEKWKPVVPTWNCGRAYCGNCGQKLPIKRIDMGISYCGYCGWKVKWE